MLNSALNSKIFEIDSIDQLKTMLQDHNKICVIIRGHSGSGKSTLSKDLQLAAFPHEFHHCEADQYFMNGDDYQFDVKSLGNAHEWCFENCFKLALQQHKRVIVSNTSTAISEFSHYADEACRYGYCVVVIRCDNEFMNVHGVPEKTLKRQKSKLKSNKLSKEFVYKV